MRTIFNWVGGAVVGLILACVVANIWPDHFATTVIEREQEKANALIETEKRQCEIDKNQLYRRYKELSDTQKNIRGYFSSTYEQVRELLEEVNKYASQKAPGEQDVKRLNQKALSLMMEMNEGREAFTELSRSLNSDATELLRALQAGTLTIYELKSRLEAIEDNEKSNSYQVDSALDKLDLE